MEKEGKCCFCGEPYYNYGNDIRPLVITEAIRGNRCCDTCNADIVIPNRLKFWKPYFYRYFIKDIETNQLINKYGLPYRPGEDNYDDLLSFYSEELAEHHIKVDQLFHHKVVRIGFVGDN